ncbi:MAG: hypothetical protein WCO13_11000 [Bacteroidota bacterium]
MFFLFLNYNCYSQTRVIVKGKTTPQTYLFGQEISRLNPVITISAFSTGGTNNINSLATYANASDVEYTSSTLVDVFKALGYKIRKITPDGVFSKLAVKLSINIVFSDAIGSITCFNIPRGIYFNATTTCRMYAEDDNHKIRKIDLSGNEISHPVSSVNRPTTFKKQACPNQAYYIGRRNLKSQRVGKLINNVL